MYDFTIAPRFSTVDFRYLNSNVMVQWLKYLFNRPTRHNTTWESPTFRPQTLLFCQSLRNWNSGRCSKRFSREKRERYDGMGYPYFALQLTNIDFLSEWGAEKKKIFMMTAPVAIFILPQFHLGHQWINQRCRERQ